MKTIRPRRAATVPGPAADERDSGAATDAIREAPEADAPAVAAPRRVRLLRKEVAATRATDPVAEPATRRALRRALRHARRTAAGETPDPDTSALLLAEGGEVLRPLPRRALAQVSAMAPPDMVPPRSPALRAGLAPTLARTLLWLQRMLVFGLANAADRLRGRASIERRAVRLHGLFQSAGGTFTRIGQELGARVDLLPFEYCRELARLRDTAPALPVAEAVAEVERAAGRPLAETFAAFDPEPITSTSLFCVYQALLRDGTKVAVKVLRPRIGARLAADLRALELLATLAEMLAIFRPGYVENVTQELRATLAEELDLRMESAHQAIFRREARRGHLGRDAHVSAPRGHFELSTSAVIVQRFTAGMWLWEILAALESRDPVGLARMRELGIDPEILARRLYRAGLWGQLVCPVYHAAPAPTNVLVQRGNALVLIDFSACGTTNRARRNLLRDLLHAQARRDVQGIARSLLAFLEPLPPIDLDTLEKKTEMLVAQVFHKVWSGHARWHEKSSAALFYRFFEIARQYDIAVSLDTARSFRAAMLYDTLALRVFPGLDVQRESRRFDRRLADERRRRFLRGVRRRIRGGLVSGRDVSMLEEVADVATRGLRAMRQQLDRPRFDFVPMVEKPVFAVVETLRLAAIAIVVTLAFTGITALAGQLGGHATGLRAAAAAVVSSASYWTLLGLVTAVSVRRVMLRLMDMKVRD